MRRLLAILVVLGACAAAVVMAGAGGEGAKGKRYEVVFDNGFGLVDGGELKIGGVSAGKITDFALTETEPRKVAVQVEITEPGFEDLRDDTRCRVRQQSLIGEYFIDCNVGKGRRLPEGGRIPVKQTSSTIPLDLINDVQRRPYRERFRIILTELGVGLAGRPKELNEVIRRAHPGLRETTETLEILARQNKIIGDYIRYADRVSEAVEPRKRDVSRWAKEASETAAVQASRRDSIAAQWRKLPTFLAELEPTAAQLERTAGEQIPLLRRFRTAGPRLHAFLRELGPFSEASRGSTRALGRAAVTGRRALTESIEEVRQLRSLSRDAPGVGKPLRQFLQTIDDRSRSMENDPLARQTAPPPPDKTAYRDGQGFTGMEALLNYIYYQTLAINVFDEVGHLLRIGAVSNRCNPYNPNPNEGIQRDCNSWLGPRQPGINAPDPTDHTRGGAGRVEAESKRLGRRREPGQPDAPPTPGRPDPSRPEFVLPPGLEDLVNQAPGRLPDAVPRGADPTGGLLNYLLGP
jgi:phospholipid/cholesterol/gamma-HCH transport system substrate-binding protein